MSLLQTEFVWRTPVKGDGYRWVDLREEGRTFGDDLDLGDGGENLTRFGTLRQDVRFRAYRPLEEESGLFRTFADMEVTPEGIVKFANRYGELGLEERRFIDTDEGGSPSIPSTTPHIPRKETDFEPYIVWCVNNMYIRRFVHYWEMLKRNDHEEIDRIVVKDRDAFSVNFYGDREEPQYQPVALPLGFERADKALALRLFLNSEISERLCNVVLYRLYWDPKTDKQIVGPRPISLLGAIHLQLAVAIAEDKEYRKCGHCVKWFEVSPHVNRSDRATCSNACRVALFRARKGTAELLHESGKTHRQIAKQLDTDVETVKGWLKKKGK